MLAIFSGFEFKKTASEFRKRKRKSLLSSFTSSTKREIRHFHVVVVQRRQRNVQTSVMHVKSCCFANLNLLLFAVLTTLLLSSLIFARTALWNPVSSSYTSLLDQHQVANCSIKRRRVKDQELNPGPASRKSR